MPLLLLLLLGGGAGVWWYLTQQQHPPTGAAPALPAGGPAPPAPPGMPTTAAPAASSDQPGPPAQTPAAPPSLQPPPGVPKPPFNLTYPGSGAWSSNHTYVATYQGALRFIAWATGNTSLDPGSVDGNYGPATKAAVQAFQKSAGLTADGQAGSTTAQALAQAVTQAVTAHQTGWVLGPHAQAGCHQVGWAGARGGHQVGGVGEEYPHPACRTWQPVGAGLQNVPPALRAQIALMSPMLAAHPACPGPGSIFSANVGGTVVQWYCAAPGRLVPVSFCSQTQAGWTLPAN